MSALLQVANLSLHGAGRCLVQDLSFTVRAGERWCVIGRNAAGKSTLLRALAGVSPGAHASVQASARTRCAYMPQAPQDRFDMTVRELIALQPSAALHGTPLQTMCDSLGQDLDIAPLLDRPITQLSGGERQRVGLAAVAAQDAQVWLLDEPVSFQDPAHQRQMGQWLMAQSAQRHVGMVMSAHDMAWVQSVATHIIAAKSINTWTIGSIDQVLEANLLQTTFGCDWQRVGGVWTMA
jgi:iron complex transport system ATP-binding protein